MLMDGGSSVIDACVGCMESVLHLLNVYEVSIFAIICDV